MCEMRLPYVQYVVHYTSALSCHSSSPSPQAPRERTYDSGLSVLLYCLMLKPGPSPCPQPAQLPDRPAAAAVCPPTPGTGTDQRRRQVRLSCFTRCHCSMGFSSASTCMGAHVPQSDACLVQHTPMPACPCCVVVLHCCMGCSCGLVFLW